MRKARHVFAHVDADMDEFKDSGIFYKKEDGKHLIFLLNTILRIEHVYVFQYLKEVDEIEITYTDCKSHGVPKKFAIGRPREKPSTVVIFELYEWLRSKLVSTPTMTTVPPELPDRPVKITENIPSASESGDESYPSLQRQMTLS